MALELGVTQRNAKFQAIKCQRVDIFKLESVRQSVELLSAVLHKLGKQGRTHELTFFTESQIRIGSTIKLEVARQVNVVRSSVAEQTSRTSGDVIGSSGKLRSRDNFSVAQNVVSVLGHRWKAQQTGQKHCNYVFHEILLIA